MKLLLTSSGLTTRNIGETLQAMVAKPASEAKVAFIPTASNVEVHDKGGVMNQLMTLWRYGFSNIDIVDFTAAGVNWEKRLQNVNVLYLTGGNTFHLLDQARKTGFDKWLLDNLENKVYVGSSASSIVVTPSIQVAALEHGDENVSGLTDLSGLGLIGCEIEPHCDAARFVEVEAYAKTRPNAVYAIDDLTAIKVVDDRTEVISSGSWKLYTN